MDLKEKIKRDRAERTRELAAEVKAGTYIQPATNVWQSWFPDRGIIKKDPNAMEILHKPKKPRLHLSSVGDD